MVTGNNGPKASTLALLLMASIASCYNSGTGQPVKAEGVGGESASNQSSRPGPKAEKGSIEGTVVYQADAERPWRYARYYVKSPKDGLMAEAVVAVTNLTDEDKGRPAKAASTVIDQKDFQFIPETIAIRVGDKVQFLNSDKEVHNVATFHPKHSFNVNMPSGGQHVETFRYPGGMKRPYRIGCIYHSSMRSWIYVFDHPFYQVTRTDGKFHLKNLPPGEYKLEIIHSAGRLRWSKMVSVEGGKSTNVNCVLSPENLPKKRLK